MPDYTTDERWRRGPRKHTARRLHVPQVGLAIRCEGCDYGPVTGTAREQEDAHRAHRVAMGENVKAQRVLPRGVRLKQAEAERDRYRSAWQSARLRAEAHSEGSQRHIEARDDWKGWMHEQAQRAEQAEAAIARVRAYCELLADGSCRVAARETAQDVLRLFDGATDVAASAMPCTICTHLRARHIEPPGNPVCIDCPPQPEAWRHPYTPKES